MASFAEQNSLGFKCDGVLSRGMVVKAGSDKSHVAKATAGTDKVIGLAMNDTSAAEDSVDVALPGGGAAGLLGGTVSFGDLLTADSAGKLVATTSANDKIVAQAMEDGVVGDIIGVNVVIGNY
jgi:hypothetical protein